jgi:osmoprotectant transport system ATP-binding protein
MNRGRLVQVGTPDELMRRPADAYVADLMATPRRQAEAVDLLLAEGSLGGPDP